MSSPTSGAPEMAAPNSAAASVGESQKVPAGFAKLQGENFEYFMQAYSIFLGHNTETDSVDFDLSKYECGTQRVSPCHAHIFYDFQRSHFSIEVLGINGCTIQGVSYPPDSDPIKLNSQDLIEIAGIKFYFLLPSRSIYASFAAHDTTSLPRKSSSFSNGENGVKTSAGMKGKLVKRKRSSSGDLGMSNCYDIKADHVGTLDGCVNKPDIRSADKDIDNEQLPEEEKHVATCIEALVSDLSGPKKWVPMEKLHSELFGRFGKNWPHDRVRRYLPQKGMSASSTEADSRPWSNLWTLLRKYPEHFVMTTLTRGQEMSEYVGLVHLVSVENES